MDKNKKLLTREVLKAKNSSLGCVLWFIIPFCLIAILMSFFIIPKNEVNTFEFAFFKIISIILPLLNILVLLFFFKKEKNQNELIDNGNFKIVEDKIYDKYISTSTDKDGTTNYHYHIFSKIYGKMSISSFVYDGIQKNDSIYLLFYNGNEFNNNYNNETIEKEYERNIEFIDQKYLANDYELDNELIPYFVSYKEFLGNTNFDNRIKNQIKELKKKKIELVCKKCGKKYKLNESDVCPECNSMYIVDIIDVVHRIEWY